MTNRSYAAKKDGVITIWNKDSPDVFTDMGPKKVMENHKSFQKYQYPTFKSALRNMRRTYNITLKKRDSTEDKIELLYFYFYVCILLIIISHFSSMISGIYY